MIYGTGDSSRPSAGAAESRIGGLKQTAPQVRAIDTRAEQPIAGFVLGLSLPPSVNDNIWRLGTKTPKVKVWFTVCDMTIMGMRPKPRGIRGPVSINILWDEQYWDDMKGGKFDIDNRIKHLLDYLQSRELIDNDRFVRSLHLDYGPASLGCIVQVTPWRGA